MIIISCINLLFTVVCLGGLAVVLGLAAIEYIKNKRSKAVEPFKPLYLVKNR